MVEFDTIGPDVNMELSADPILNNEKNNLDVESTIEVSNKRSRDEPVNGDSNENSAKKLRQETGSENGDSNEHSATNLHQETGSENVFITEISSVVENYTDKMIIKEEVKLLKDEKELIQQINHQEKIEDIEIDDDETNNKIVNDNLPNKEEILEEENNTLEINFIEEEYAASSEEAKDKSVEIYIQEEIEKGVKESMKKWLQSARNQLIEECKLAVITKEMENEKKDKDDTEEILNSEQQKKSCIVEDTEKDSKKREKKRDELIKAILAEKELEEKEKLLKLKREKLKIFENKILKEEEEIKEKRRQNQVWLEKKLKEWENDGKKSVQNVEQGSLIQDNGVQENCEQTNGEIKDDSEIKKVETREEIESTHLLNKLRELQKTRVKTEATFLKREGRRPDQMSPGEWTQEDKERRKRRRNVKIKGLNPRNWRTGREIQDFFRREMRVEVTVDSVTRVGMDLVVGFRSLSEKMEVLRKRAKVKNCGIWIGDDLTLREEEVQQWLKNEADWLRLKGRIIKLGHLKMTINGQRWIWNEVKGDLVPEVF